MPTSVSGRDDKLFKDTYDSVWSSFRRNVEKNSSTLQVLSNHLFFATSQSNLQSVQTKHFMLKERLAAQIKYHEDVLSQIQSVRRSAEGICLQHQLANGYRLQQQYSSCERKLQELTFEIIGEYQKIIARGKAREEYLSTMLLEQKILFLHKNAWKLFLIRLQYDYTCQFHKAGLRPSLNTFDSNKFLSTQLFDFPSNTLEMEWIAKKLHKKLNYAFITIEQPEQIQPMNVIKLSISLPNTNGNNGSGKATNNRLPAGHEHPKLLTTVGELQQYLQDLATMTITIHSNSSINSNSNANASATNERPKSRASTSHKQSNNPLLPHPPATSATNLHFSSRKEVCSGMQYLSNKAIQWLKPFDPRVMMSLGDTIIRHHTTTTTTSTTTSNSTTSCRNNTLSNLLSRLLYAQQNEWLNEYCYVCLEERALLTQLLPAMTSSTSTNTTATHSSSTFTTSWQEDVLNSKQEEEGKGDGEDLLLLNETYLKLQECYCDYPYTHAILGPMLSTTTTASLSNKDNTNKKQATNGSTSTKEELEVLYHTLSEILTSHPLQIIDLAMTKHRQAFQSQYTNIRSKQKAQIDEVLRVFPNVVKVQSLVNPEIILHFVPMMQGNAFEAWYCWNNTHNLVSNGEIDQIPPPPPITTAVTGGNSPINTNAAAGAYSANVMMGYNIFAATTFYHTANIPSSSLIANKKEMDNNTNNKKKDGGYSVYMLPLHKPTLAAYCFPASSTSSTTVTATTNNANKPNPPPDWSCLDMLPDHLHVPLYATIHSYPHTTVTTTSSSAASLSRPTSATMNMNNWWKKQTLHKPFLVYMTDEKPPAIVTSSSDTNSNNSNNNNAISVYLIQLAPFTSSLSSTITITESRNNDEPQPQHQLNKGIRRGSKEEDDEDDEMCCMVSKQIVPLVLVSSTTNNTNVNDISQPLITPRTARPSTTTASTPTNTNADSSTSTTTTTVKRWNLDTTILSAVCQWRSCLCTSTIPPTTTTTVTKPDDYLLCIYHQEIKSFLDTHTSSSSSSSTTSEANKYLPKKTIKFPASLIATTTGAAAVTTNDANASNQTMLSSLLLPSTMKKHDFFYFRAASTLLQEVWDKRLKITLKQFITKTVLTQTSYVYYLEQTFPSLILYFGNHHGLLLMPYLTTINNNNSSSSSGGGNVSPARSPIRLPMNSSNHNNKSYALSLNYPTWHLYRSKPTTTNNTNNNNNNNNNNVVISNAADNILTLQAQIVSCLQDILTMETLLVHTELPIFIHSLSYFPYQEVLMMKKDMKSFKEKQEQYLVAQQQQPSSQPSQPQIQGNNNGDESNNSLNTSNTTATATTATSSTEERYQELLSLLQEEWKVTQKKVILFQQRRNVEEEHLLQQQRKLARLKVMEEKQSQDPSHFSHQSGRF